MGTSTCHVMSSDQQASVPGMCGVVDGGILPGLWGYEAGQSGVGDIFGWFVRTGFPAAYAEEAGYNVIDFGGVLSGEDYSPYFFYYNSHYSPAGNERVAVEIVRFIEQLERDGAGRDPMQARP